MHKPHRAARRPDRRLPCHMTPPYYLADKPRSGRHSILAPSRNTVILESHQSQGATLERQTNQYLIRLRIISRHCANPIKMLAHFLLSLKHDPQITFPAIPATSRRSAIPPINATCMPMAASGSTLNLNKVAPPQPRHDRCCRHRADHRIHPVAAQQLCSKYHRT
jgi:hypothetical protein